MQTHFQQAIGQIVPQTLYVVATPIGNLADISLRALAVFQKADLICAEDTRVARQLLNAFHVQVTLLSVREQNENKMAEKVIEALANGQIVAQISDAGTPAVCDPGARLVNAVRNAGFPVSPIVGASAVMAALSVAGVIGSEFHFLGFLPAKKTLRIQTLERLNEATCATVMFEAPHRIVETLSEMASLYPARHLVLARELTKTFETVVAGRVEAVLQAVLSTQNMQKGEMVLVLHENSNVQPRDILGVDPMKAMKVLSHYLKPTEAAQAVAQLLDVSKKDLYNEWLKYKNPPQT